MKKIALIYMGGTFGCVGTPLAPMPAPEFIPQLQNILNHRNDVDCFAAPVMKDSSACTPQDWLQLIQYIQKLQQDYQHFVVIHGTDTLSYAAAVLAQFLAQSSHVVITGSQYPLLNVDGTAVREFSDALDNLNTALDAVVYYPAGVYLAFHQHVLHAQTALKQHSTELDAFYGLAAQQAFLANRSAYHLQSHDLEKAKNFNCLNLMIQPLDLEQHIGNLQMLLHRPPDFLILQGFGIGNLAANSTLMDVLNQLYVAGCISILTSQVPFGGLDQRYVVSAWTEQAKIVRSDCASHADLYAKALKMYLQYASPDERWAHWQHQQV